MGSEMCIRDSEWPEQWKALRPLATWGASLETKQRVTESARSAAVERGWRLADTVVDEPSLENGRWNFVLWRLPRMPGGHDVVTVSSDGKVLDYLRGK